LKSKIPSRVYGFLFARIFQHGPLAQGHPPQLIEHYDYSSKGHFVCTAAINSDGSIATDLTGQNSHIDPATTLKGPDSVPNGTYQVGFKAPCGNVQIANGWFRVVQPDTLTIGTLPPRYCYVADRFGVPNALWIQCFNSGGVLKDTSFTVSVSR
jgi:hypothetical protein